MPNLDNVYDVTDEVTWDERKTNKQVIYRTTSMPSFVTFDAFYFCLWLKTLSLERHLGGNSNRPPWQVRVATVSSSGPLRMSNATSLEQRVTALLTLILVLAVNFKCFQFSFPYQTICILKLILKCLKCIFSILTVFSCILILFDQKN